MSPFQDLPQQGGPPRTANHTAEKWVLVGVLSVVGVLTLFLIIGFLWKRTVNDPYRTLEVLSPEKYFENPRALIGNRFQATMRVEGDLGWQEGVGKLMVFSVADDNRFIPVLVKGENLSYSFSKGQMYLGQVTVGEGGLLYATDLRKK